ncbi:MAG: 4-alpha-glucanotransferase [Synechococcus sp.]
MASAPPSPSTSEPAPRGLGVLLHPTALPGSPVCGGFGSATRTWLRALARDGISVWQVLPLAPTDGTGSPYSSPSSFAINPWLLDAQDLVDQGFLTSASMEALPGQHKAAAGESALDCALADQRADALAVALQLAWPQQSAERHAAFAQWCADHASWLDDHVMFMELRRQYSGQPWWEWPQALACRHRFALRAWRFKHQQALEAQRLVQWHLDQQWQALRALADQLGVRIFGDLPFYVARDSADVWSHRSLFSIQRDGTLTTQSGVPPDYFSATGQLWGTPVYRWWRHRFTRFRWWRARLRRQWQLLDLLRLDHFRALAAYWAVPGGDDTAARGVWRPSPGQALLRALKADAGGQLPMVAEDLGVVTADVEALRDQFALPGMKILQFAFDGNPDNPYLPANIHGDRWVVYTGTHDNPTTIGWWRDLDPSCRERVQAVVGQDIHAPGWQLLELGLASSAGLVITPVQDLLHLDDAARFNTPGTVGGRNWCWRLSGLDQRLDDALRGYGERAALWGRR